MRLHATRSLLCLVAALLAPTACVRETQHVVVSLYPQGLSPTARWLFVHTALGGQSTLLSNRFDGAPAEVDLQFPDEASGEADFTLESRDPFGEPLESGSASVMLMGTGQYTLDVPLTATPRPTVLFLDAFDSGNLAGYSMSDLPYNGLSDASYSEANGVVQLSGGSTIKELTSKSSFDPTGTTLTVVIASRQRGQSIDGGSNAVGIGWLPLPPPPQQPQNFLCCSIGFDYILSDFELIFDASAQQNNYRYLEVPIHSALENDTYDSPPATEIILSIYVDQAGWRVEALGPGLQVQQQGTYHPGVGLADVLKASGGVLSPAISTGRQYYGAAIDSILVTHP